MLAFVYLATLVATFAAPAILAVPALTNTGLYPRETSGTYKVYLNADSFEGSASKLLFKSLPAHVDFVFISCYLAEGEGDGATNDET
jgi:hypothetical protein